MSDLQTSWVSLRSAALHAQINPLGAQLSVLRDHDGHDLLWNGDPAVWAGRAPLLFPIIGELAGGSYRLGSKVYRLPRHGFARGRMFEVLEATSSRATFRLQADEASLQVYPFRFRLDVSFTLEGATLGVNASVGNLGDTDMTASFGYHPGLRWPLPFGQPRASHFIEFAGEEAPWIRRLNPAGLMTAEHHPTPLRDRKLVLEDSLFRDDVIIFEDICSRSVIYGAETGPRIRVGFPDASYLGIWTKPGAGFVCIEPWQGVADEAGFSGDFSEKTGVFRLAPNAVRPVEMQITLLHD